MKPVKIKDCLDDLKVRQDVWIKAEVTEIDKGDGWPLMVNLLKRNRSRLNQDQTICLSEPTPTFEWVRYEDRKPTGEDKLSGEYLVSDGLQVCGIFTSLEPDNWAYYLRNFGQLANAPIAKKKDPGYGYTLDGEKIKPPKGWEIVPEGERIPSPHLWFSHSLGWRECRKLSFEESEQGAGLCSKVRAYARRKYPKPRILVDPDTGERFEVMDGKVLKEVEG